MSQDPKTEMSIALSSMWDYLMTLSEEGRLDDEAVAHIFNAYSKTIKKAFDIAADGGD